MVCTLRPSKLQVVQGIYPGFSAWPPAAAALCPQATTTPWMSVLPLLLPGFPSSLLATMTLVREEGIKARERHDTQGSLSTTLGYCYYSTISL